MAGLALLGMNAGEGETSRHGARRDANGVSWFLEAGDELHAGTRRAKPSANDHAEQVVVVHRVIAAVGQISADLIGAGYLVVDLRDRGVNLQRRCHDLLGDALMKPEQLPAIHRRGTAGKLSQVPNFRQNADEIGRLFRCGQGRSPVVSDFCGEATRGRSARTTIDNAAQESHADNHATAVLRAVSAGSMASEGS